MIWTLLAVVTMVALGGFIAYYGDIQGTRWGKRRVSWFGLRPKHTAKLITGLTGAVIVLFSVLTLLLISPSVRTVVLRGERLINENRALLVRQREDTRRYDQMLREEQARLNETKALYISIQQEYQSVCKQLTEQQRQVKEAGDKNKALQEKKAALETRLGQVEQTLRQEKAAIGKLQLAERQLASNNKTLAELNKNAASLNSDLSKDNDNQKRENAALEKINKELEETNTRLTQGNADIKAESERLRAIRDQLQQITSAQQKENDTLFQANVQLDAKIRELTQKQEQLYGQLAGADQAFTQTYAELRQRPIILTAGELMARRILPTNSGPAMARQEIEGLLNDANRMAMQRGAVMGENGRAVRIIRKRIVSPAGQEDTDEKASIEALVANVSPNNSPIALIASAFNNSVQGEQVIIELSFRRIGRIFDNGEIVASRHLNASLSEAAVEDALAAFLQQDVRAAAVKAGMIPQIDLLTGAKSIGNIRSRDLANLTRRVRDMGGEVVITATAKGLTYATDPLALDFKLTRSRLAAR